LHIFNLIYISHPFQIINYVLIVIRRVHHHPLTPWDLTWLLILLLCRIVPSKGFLISKLSVNLNPLGRATASSTSPRLLLGSHSFFLLAHGALFPTVEERSHIWHAMIRVE
jgi:hypothetical protein